MSPFILAIIPKEEKTPVREDKGFQIVRPFYFYLCLGLGISLFNPETVSAEYVAAQLRIFDLEAKHRTECYHLLQDTFQTLTVSSKREIGDSFDQSRIFLSSSFDLEAILTSFSPNDKLSFLTFHHFPARREIELSKIHIFHTLSYPNHIEFFLINTKQKN